MKSSISPNCGNHGFTLIELMVVITIAAILLALAGPSFISAYRNARLNSYTNGMMAAINATRSEAMKRNVFALMQPKDGSDWNTGWIIFVDTDMNMQLDRSKDIVIVEHESHDRDSFIQISSKTNVPGSSGTLVAFDGSGFAKGNNASVPNTTLTLKRTDVPVAEQDGVTRRIKIARSGRVRACRPKEDTTCTE
jgi:tfp pilus assembly protein fimT